MQHTRSLSVNIIANLINRVSDVLFPLITFPYVSRVLRPEGLGRVNFAEAVVGYFALFASLGIPLYGIRESAKRRDDKIALSTLAVELSLLNLIMTGAACAAFGIFMLCSRKAAADPLLFWISTLPMLLAPVGFNWLFGGLEEYVYITIRTIVFRVFVLAAIFLFVHSERDVRIYALINGLNIAGANVLNLFFLRRHISLRHVRWQAVSVARYVRPVLVVFAMVAVISIYTSINKVMLGYLADDRQVGLYSAASRLVRVIVMLVTSMGAVLLPRVSYYIEHQRMEDYGRLAQMSLRLVSFLSFPAAAGLMVLAGPLVLLLCGPAYRGAVVLVQITALDVVLIALSNFMGYQVLYPQGKEKLMVCSVLLGATCNFGLNWLLIPRWQAAGAALATLIAETCVTGAQIFLSRSCSPFRWPVLGLLKYAAGATAMGILVLYVRSFFIGHLLRLLVPLAVGGAFYLMLMHLLGDRLSSVIWRRLAVVVTPTVKEPRAGS